MYRGGRRNIAPFNQREPRRLGPPALAADQFRHKHAAGRQNVGNMSCAGSARRRPGRPEKDRVKMGDIERGHTCRQSMTHRRRPIEAAQQTTGKIGNPHAFPIDGPPERHRTLAGPIDIGREDVDVVPSLRQATRQRVNRPYGTAIARCGPVGRDNVENTQAGRLGSTISIGRRLRSETGKGCAQHHAFGGSLGRLFDVLPEDRRSQQ